MLRSMLAEIGRQLRPRKQDITADPLLALESLRNRWRSALPGDRESLSVELERWIEGHPGFKQGWSLRAEWALQRKDLMAAESDYRRALQIDPLSPEAQEGLGLTLLYGGKLDQAYLHLEQAHRSQPMNSEVLTHWALVALEQGNLADAESKLIKAIERNPRNPHAWHNLGLVCIRGGQPQDGIPHIQRALELKPDFGQAWSNLALAWRETEDLDQALVAARRATELKSGHARVWVILADLLVDAGQFDAADQALYRAASLDPDDAGAEIARAKWASALGDHARARQAFGRALILEPDHPEAQGGLGQLELLCGRFDIGWDLYEARQRTLNRPVRSFGHPVWSGESLQGKTLLVHAEQGLGDNILFASCLPDVIHQARSVVLETAPTLAALFSRSFPGAHVVGRDPRDPSREWLSRLPPVDMEITAGSLPRWTRRDMASFPARQAYLQADPQRVAQRREELQQFGQGPWIGIAWRGGMVRTAGVQRSIDLVTVLRPLQGLPVRWVSLQYGEVGDELQAAAQDTGIAVHHIPDSMRDQDEAAALTSALDGVVTVCQTQAHLTGALGRPGWVLVPSNPNWRYGWQGTSTPWYPSLTLVRQKLHGDWTEVLGELRLELEQCLMSEIAGR